jgi:aspartyl/asparaginyl beta-hydroxylase (cupin superfamily)
MPTPGSTRSRHDGVSAPVRVAGLDPVSIPARRGARTFYDPAGFPELASVRAAWREVRDEALAARSLMSPLDDARTQPGAWTVLPLLPEAEDRDLYTDGERARCRSTAPRTVELLGSVAGVRGYVFSSLAPGARIAAHRHSQPYVTAALCLQGGVGATIEVGGERRRFVDGEWTVFDYTLVHEVTNDGPFDRVVLLVLLPRPPRRAG